MPSYGTSSSLLHQLLFLHRLIKLNQLFQKRSVKFGLCASHAADDSTGFQDNSNGILVNVLNVQFFRAMFLQSIIGIILLSIPLFFSLLVKLNLRQGLKHPCKVEFILDCLELSVSQKSNKVIGNKCRR